MGQTFFSIGVIRTDVRLIFFPFIVFPNRFFEIVRVCFLISPHKKYIKSTAAGFGGSRFTCLQYESFSIGALEDKSQFIRELVGEGKPHSTQYRSEERRAGKECRSRWS